MNALLNGRRMKSAGLASLLVLMGAFNIDLDAYGQTAARQPAQIATTPWTSQNGREIIDLNARGSNARSATLGKNARLANPIRQTQALSAPTLQRTPLEEAFVQNPELAAPMGDPAQVGDSFSDSFGASGDQSGETIQPLESMPGMPAASPSAIQEAETSVQSEEEKSYPTGPILSTETSPQKAAPTANGDYGRQPIASNNPYSRIGQAEYHPSQFYGMGGNYSVNGYRNTPPAVAYGQSLCGTPCVDGSCGLFGGFFQNSEAEIGFVGMRSPLDFEDAGNFGADVALNWGSVRPVVSGFHVQAGARAVFTDFNGVVANGFETDDNRTQLFWTAGLYYRSNECADGWTLGVVYDSMKDDYYRKYSLQQLRAELSYTFAGLGAFGFRGAFGLNDEWCDFLSFDGIPIAEVKAKATDYYTMFYRKEFELGGEATFFGGVTEWSEGLIGFSAQAPLCDSLSIRCSGTYVFPEERNKHAEYRLKEREEECWNMSLGFVWRPGGSCNAACGSRPLFDVADNGTFLQNFLR